MPEAPGAERSDRDHQECYSNATQKHEKDSDLQIPRLIAPQVVRHLRELREV
jgi:hypothetical protein